MEGESILQTMAEIAVAFAGFTGVVAAFGHRSAAAWSLGDRVRFQVMLGTSLAALLFALLPFILYHLGVQGEAIWALSSGLLAAYFCGSTIFDARLFRAARRSAGVGEAASPVVGAAVGLVSLGAMMTQVLNALGVFFHRGFGAFLLGVAALLVLSSLMFVRLLSFVHRGGGTE